MDLTRKDVAAPDEAFGIVISRGGSASVAPRFSSYVWGPAPDDAPGADADARANASSDASTKAA